MTDALLTIQQVSAILGVKPGALAQMRYEGRGPKFVKVSAKVIGYRESDLEAWIESRVRQSTAQEAA